MRHSVYFCTSAWYLAPAGLEGTSARPWCFALYHPSRYHSARVLHQHLTHKGMPQDEPLVRPVFTEHAVGDGIACPQDMRSPAIPEIQAITHHVGARAGPSTSTLVRGEWPGVQKYRRTKEEITKSVEREDADDKLRFPGAMQAGAKKSEAPRALSPRVWNQHPLWLHFLGPAQERGFLEHLANECTKV
jgi:hypothetical protein